MAKSKYNPDTFPALAEGYAREGLTEKDIAAKLGVAVSTFEDYKKKYPLFLEALLKGKEPVDFQVVNAGLKSALGFKETIRRGKVLSDGTVVHYDDELYFPPNPKMIEMWLCNRKNNIWKRNPDLAKENADKESIDDQLKQIAENQRKIDTNETTD